MDQPLRFKCLTCSEILPNPTHEAIAKTSDGKEGGAIVKCPGCGKKADISAMVMKMVEAQKRKFQDAY